MGFNIDPYQLGADMKKILKVVSGRLGEGAYREQGNGFLVVDDKGNPRRFTKKGAFSFLRTHGDKIKVKVTDDRDCWLAVLEGE
jgi:hypothetical protein